MGTFCSEVSGLMAKQGREMELIFEEAYISPDKQLLALQKGALGRNEGMDGKKFRLETVICWKFR
jgi:hypothetical protein